MWKLKLCTFPTSSLWKTVASFMVARDVRSIWVWYLAGLCFLLPKAASWSFLMSTGSVHSITSKQPCHLQQILSFKLRITLAFWVIWNLILICNGQGKGSGKHDSFSLSVSPQGLLESPSLQFALSLSESFQLSLTASLSRQWAHSPQHGLWSSCITLWPCQQQTAG